MMKSLLLPASQREEPQVESLEIRLITRRNDAAEAHHLACCESSGGKDEVHWETFGESRKRWLDPV